MNDLISIIVPIYNSEMYLERCIESIINQTYKNIEIILINDGSEDKSLEICKRYNKIDKRVKIINQENKGVSYTRNVGVKNSNGKYILFIDSDDSIEPEMISNMVYICNNNRSDIVVCSYDNGNLIKNPNKERFIDVWDKQRSIEEFIIHNKLKGMLWNKLIKRKFFDYDMFDENVGYAEDAQVMWKIINKVNQITIINDEYYHHYINSDSISNKKFSSNKLSEIRVWKEILDDVKEEFPMYIEIASARYGDVCTFMLYDMIRNQYNNYKAEKYLIENVKKYFINIMNSKYNSKKMKLFAILISINCVNILKKILKNKDLAKVS